MPITKIPDTYRAGLAKIKALSPADASALETALGKAPLSGGFKGLVSTVGDEIPALRGDDLGEILRVLYSLYIYRGDEDAELPNFVAQIMTAMKSSSKDLALSGEEAVAFQARITRLLGINSLAIASKAEQLRSDFPNTFHSVKIITDVRPIFSKPEDQPIGAAIVHTLKIEYHQGRAHREFYVSLDADELAILKKTVARAEVKASSLISLLKAASLRNLSEEKSQ